MTEIKIMIQNLFHSMTLKAEFQTKRIAIWTRYKRINTSAISYFEARHIRLQRSYI